MTNYKALHWSYEQEPCDTPLTDADMHPKSTLIAHQESVCVSLPVCLCELLYVCGVSVSLGESLYVVVVVVVVVARLHEK